ncbi:SigE-dependent sporulation protein [Neobacillus mesonae]|uniref:SigE-dependent sporulation protein n=1 Tax=Neobacillus mesonae TaxID=1193713 RepID=A0A3Q9QTD5_9BACI|nr:SigE-dependent sporulation protein [Neobacillus mesonae]
MWTTTLKGEKTLTLPIWIYAVVVGIVISALMAIKTGREERQLEMENIELEGEIYMKRLEREKEMRQELKATGE